VIFIVDTTLIKLKPEQSFQLVSVCLMNVDGDPRTWEENKGFLPASAEFSGRAGCGGCLQFLSGGGAKEVDLAPDWARYEVSVLQ
jgi:hypothetical protein